MSRRSIFLSLLLLLLQRAACNDDNNNCSDCTGSSEFDIFRLYTSMEKKAQLITMPLNEAPRTNGSDPNEPSFQFAGNHFLKDNGSDSFGALTCAMCYRHEITIHASLLFLTDDKGGPVIELSHDLSPVLGLDVNCKGDVLSITFSHQGQLVVEKFDVKFEIGVWYKIAVQLSGNLLRLYLNCERIESRLVSIPDYCPNFTNPLVQIGTNFKEEPYTGSLQSVRLVVSDCPLQKQCPDIDCDSVDVDCPVCGSMLTTMKMLATEKERVKSLLEEKENQQDNCTNGGGEDSAGSGRSCLIDDITYPDKTFTKKQDGMICYCRNGNPQCTDPNSLTTAPTPSVKVASSTHSLSATPVPVVETTPVCPEKNVNNQVIVLKVGEVTFTKISNNQCQKDECEDSMFGGVRYKTAVQYSCDSVPQDCSSITDEETRSIALCCGRCVACNFASCPPNTHCVSMGLKHECLCNTGYEKSGEQCVDRDECALGLQQGGHDCPAKATCNNTEGSFECLCPKFFEIQTIESRKDCVDIDECSLPNACPTNTTCVNEPLGYRCDCPPNFKLVGDKCKPICCPACENGGTCAEPNICSCAPGFTGKWCESDIDECEGNDHKCKPPKYEPEDLIKCVNTFGGYFCTCQTGLQLIGETGTCRTFNECSTGLHYCFGNSTCQDTTQGYICRCNNAENKGAECDGKCHLQNGTVLDNGHKEIKGCAECKCKDGRYTCQQRKCNCSASNSNHCCPQCSRKDHCFGRDNLVLKVGEHRFYPTDKCSFTSCERENEQPVLKMNREVDCPELNCSNGKMYTPRGTCCSVCQLPSCTESLEGRVVRIKNGGTCEECSCNAQSWTCEAKDCSCSSLENCPSKYITNLKEGACPICVKSSYSQQTCR